MIKQKKISIWLKGLCVLLALMGLAFFSITIWAKLNILNIYGPSNANIVVCFTLIIAFLCYAVLFEFWKVCSEIGKDNSFSLENAKSFHNMAIYGGIALASYMVRIIYFLIKGTSNVFPIALAIGCICLCVVFIIVCEALSQLITNAYEMKLENDLTI